jgi:hypothetical protein
MSERLPEAEKPDSGREEGGETLESAEVRDTAEQIGRDFENIGEQLTEVDSSKITPEQFGILRGKIDATIGVLIAYAGLKTAGLAWDVNTGGDVYAGAFEEILRHVGSVVLGVPGLGLMWAGAQKFLEGVGVYFANQPKKQPAQATTPDVSE